MSAGRIETYVHSDSVTSNKGAVIVKTTCDTDFGARTPEFIAFAAKAAKLSYAAGATCWSDVVALFPDAETERADLAKALKEKVAVNEIAILKI